FILQERLSGRSARSIAKQLSLTVGGVNASLDRTLPTIDNAMRLRHISLDLHRLDGLLETFYKRAIEKTDTQGAVAVVTIVERKAAVVGLAQPTQRAGVRGKTQQPPPEVDQGYEAIMRVARGRSGANSNGSGPVAGDGGDRWSSAAAPV